MNRLLRRVVISLVQGLLLWWLYRALEVDASPVTHHAWIVALIVPAVLVPAAHFLLEDVGDARRGMWVLLPLALALLGLGWHHGAWTANESYYRPISFALPLFVLVFHALPFVQAWLASGRLRPAYHELFHYAWRNTLLAGFGAVFSGVFWLLLWLWGELFRMLGIQFFIDLFTESCFAIPATAVAFGVGLHLAGSVERLQDVLRHQLLAMLKWLTPLAMLILTLFTLALLVKTPGLLLEQRHVISAGWLLWLVALSVALLNAAYQDGRVPSPYPPWLGAAIRWIVPLLTIVAVLAAYALLVRADSYGLTVPRAWGLLVAAVGLAYAFGYAWAAFDRTAWMARMGPVNVGIALGTITLLTLMLTPVLSPERLSAASQQARVLADQEPDAMAYLRFDSGRYGRERLQALAELTDHPKAAAIRSAAALELEKRDPWQAGRRASLPADSFEAFPAGSVLEPELLAALQTLEDQNGLNHCSAIARCLVLFEDMDRDGVAEALVFTGYEAIGAKRESKGWKLRREYAYYRGRAWPELKALRHALAEGRYAVRDPDWQTLEVLGTKFTFDVPDQAPAAKADPSD